MRYKRQQYWKKAESKKLVLAEKPDDGAIHMPMTLNDGKAVHHSRCRAAFLGMTTVPIITNPTQLASSHWPGLISCVPTQSLLPLVHKETGT